jgi:class 3 adenylate cyclase/predicted ATPase
MNCNKCHFKAPPDAQFCPECGARLVIICTECETENSISYKFCKKCGQRLDIDTEHEIPESKEPEGGELEAERRQLTVMFCDLVGSTALSERLDPEQFREMIIEYQNACAEVISRFDGQIAQYLGDGILIYFGYPLAHEDDPLRAIRAGLGILDTMGRLNSRLSRNQDLRLSVRLGIHTGQVVVGEIGGSIKHEQLALGETPNLAAHLQEIGEPNTIVISAATKRLLHGLFECRDLGTHTMKGATSPLQAFRVLGESQVQHRLEGMSLTGLTPLVSREQEIGLILERWGQVMDGLGQVILLSGEAGIGKSRIVLELRERVVNQPHTWLEGRCTTFTENTAFHPVLLLLHQFFSWTGDLSMDMRVTKMEQALQEIGLETANHVPVLSQLYSMPLPEHYEQLKLSPQEQREQTMKTLLSCLLATARGGPVVLVIEDLHWVDPSTLELLELLIDQLRIEPILAVLTFRPEFDTPWRRRSHLNPIHLNRLTRGQAAQMVERIAGMGLPAALTEQLVSRTDGVPLFVEELTKMVLESGLLEGRLTAGSIPSTLQDSLMARLDRLGTAKHLAQLGAVIGRDFSYDLIRAVSPSSEEELQDDLKRLEQAELVFRRGFPPEATYSFKHSLIQDAAYDSLLKKKRKKVHEGVAHVLEEHGPELRDTQPELLAHHFAEAGLLDKSIAYYQRAGERANERSANKEAITHLTKGLELLATLPDTPEHASRELALQLALGSPLIATKGMSPEVWQAYSRAREICKQTGESEELVFRSTWGLWSHINTHGNFEAAQELADELLQMAQRLNDPGFFLQALHAQWTIDFYSGSAAAAQKHVDEGFALYRADEHHAHAFVYAGHDPGVCALSLGAMNLWLLGYPDQARKRCLKALNLAKELAHTHSLAWGFGYPAMVYVACGDRTKAKKRAEELIALSKEHGFPHWLSIGTAIQGWVLSVDGRHSRATAKILEAIRLMHESGFHFFLPFELALLGEICLRAEQIEEGLHALNEEVDRIRQPGRRFYESELFRLRAELTLMEAPEDVHRVETDIRKAIDIARRQNAKSHELRAVMGAYRLAQRQGEDDQARMQLSDLYNSFNEGQDTRDLIEAKSLLEST